MTIQSKKYLDDILYSINLVEEFLVETDSFTEYSNDKKTKSAIERQLAIIGEAANKYDKLNLNAPLENTSQIIGLRNRIVHAYDNIDDSVIWVIIRKYLPILKIEIIEKLSK